MTFWTNEGKVVEPKRKYRFLVGNGTWYYAKSVEKPSFEVTSNEYQLINHKFKYPGIVQWNDINIVVVDTTDENVTGLFFDSLGSFGYRPNTVKNGFDGLSKDLMRSKFQKLMDDSDVVIQQLDADGNAIEEWILKNPFIKSINFSDLSYSDDGIIEISIAVSYDRAELK